MEEVIILDLVTEDINNMLTMFPSIGEFTMLVFLSTKMAPQDHMDFGVVFYQTCSNIMKQDMENVDGKKIGLCTIPIRF